MAGAMKLAMTFTAVDAASSVLMGLEKKILRLGHAGTQVKKDFEKMVSSFRAGIKAIAATKYLFDTVKPGVEAAADLQEAMTNVKMNIASSAKNAEELNGWLKSVEKTAMSVAANQPFTATQIAETSNELLKAGIKFQDVIGSRGAAWSAGGLSALSKMDPADVAMQMGKVSEAFNIKGGGQFKEFADWMSKVDDATATKIPELFYGLKMAGTGMQSFRVSVKDTITALGALSPLGDMAGTSLGRFVTRMAGTTKESRKYMKKLGLDFFKDGKFIGLEAAVDQTVKKLAGIKDERKRKLFAHKNL